MTRYKFIRKLADGSERELGVAVGTKLGWCFLPSIPGRLRSQRRATMEQCVPYWVRRYPAKSVSWRKVEDAQ